MTEKETVDMNWQKLIIQSKVVLIKKKIEQSNQTRESYSNELKVIQLENQNKELESRIGDYQTEIMSLKNSIVFKEVGFKNILLCTNT